MSEHGCSYRAALEAEQALRAQDAETIASLRADLQHERRLRADEAEYARELDDERKDQLFELRAERDEALARAAQLHLNLQTEQANAEAREERHAAELTALETALSAVEAERDALLAQAGRDGGRDGEGGDGAGVVSAYKLTARDVDALNRCLLAERFTSPSSKPIATHNTYLRLSADGLVEFRNGFRLTDKGRAALDAHNKSAEPTP